MTSLLWSTAAPAIGSAFLASVVEVVEAFTIILAVGTLRGWRSAIAGTLAALSLLGGMIAGFGSLLGQVPLHRLQLAIGILLLLFGMGWLRKAILRAAGVIPLHDEAAIFSAQSRAMQGHGTAAGRASGGVAEWWDWTAAVTAFKAVLLEGLEVVFIVIAVGSGRGLLWPASIGAMAAGLVVVGAGLAIRRPLARVPENSLKFAVGVMLSSFGVFWTGEGLGIAWPGQDLALLLFALMFLAAGLITAGQLRSQLHSAAREMVR